MSDIPFRQRLEMHNNPDEVRQRLAAGNYNQQHARVAQEYLDSLEHKESSEAAARAEARDEEALKIARSADSIAKEALRIARHERNIAIIAAIAAIAAAVAAISDSFMTQSSSITKNETNNVTTNKQP